MIGPRGDTIDPPVPSFYTESHRALQSSASKPDYPIPRTRRSKPPRNSPKTSNHSVADTSPMSKTVDPTIRIDSYSCKRCTLYPHDAITHVSREHAVSQQGTYPSPVSPKPCYVDYRWHTNWLRYTRVRGTDWHPCWTHVQQMSHGPSPASSPLHSASCRTKKIRVPACTKPEAHTPGHMVVRL